MDPYRRPHRWSEGEGHFAIERFATPEGVVGKPSRATAEKAKRPIAAILKYLTLLHDHILEAFPAGTVPPVEKVSLRDPAELEPFLKEPFSKGGSRSTNCPISDRSTRAKGGEPFHIKAIDVSVDRRSQVRRRGV